MIELTIVSILLSVAIITADLFTDYKQLPTEPIGHKLTWSDEPVERDVQLILEGVIQ